MSNHHHTSVLGWVALLVSISVPLAYADDQPTDIRPRDGGFTRSMGIPSLTKVYTGVEAQWYRPGDVDGGAGLFDLGVYRYHGNPTVGVLAFGAEAYVGSRQREVDGGVRLQLLMPSLYVGFGIDYNMIDQHGNFLLRLDAPVRRGGIVGGGSSLAFRWIPGRDTISLGLTFPLGDPAAGRTRPLKEYVRLDERAPDRIELTSGERDLTGELAELAERARWIARLSQPFTEESGADAQEAMEGVVAELATHLASNGPDFPEGHGLGDEIRVFHETLDRTFSLVTTDRPVRAGESTELGRRTSAAAREALLDHVLFPYNSLLGLKKRDDTLSASIAAAQTDFGRWLVAQPEISRTGARQSFFVFQTLCDTVEEIRANLAERWEDNRLVWLPLHYGFKAEEHDTQSEVDRILERATNQEMAAGNRLWYIVNEEFQWEMARSVRRAEDYHVLWIHDVSGVNHHGDPDKMAFLQVVNYLEALIERVKAYDETRKLPMYMIMLDQHYFEVNKSRLWMHLLEAPLDHEISLGSKREEEQRKLEALQAELRAAVEESLLLRFERSQYGEAWLKNRIKVHVNITNPADPSFRSTHIIGIVPVPDNNMRDHRKIIFYDLTEDDPYRGMAMFTGMGIGEHYVGENWEDRAVMIQGPSALPVKTAAYDLLRIQGFAEDQIPYPLRPKRRTSAWDRSVDERLAKKPAWVAGAEGIMQLHNETGFTLKPINVGKAVLYSMMPAGSVLKVPDSLWQSNMYASLLAGSALRGCRVLIISPSLPAAPSSGWPQMARAHGLMGRLIALSNGLRAPIEDAGGVLQVGLYAPHFKVGEIAGRWKQAAENSPRWDKQVYNFHPDVVEVALNAAAILDSIGFQPTSLGESDAEAQPKLHLKANFFASRAAWDDFFSRPEWAGILREYILQLARQQSDQDAASENTPDIQAEARRMREYSMPFLEEYFGTMSEEERDAAILYLTVGSVNMDYRSMTMNGEVMVLLGGFESLAGILDFLMLAGLCEWPESQEELDALLPPPGGIKRRFASFVKLAL